jgi:hypothetical protein
MCLDIQDNPKTCAFGAVAVMAKAALYLNPLTALVTAFLETAPWPHTDDRA